MHYAVINKTIEFINYFDACSQVCGGYGCTTYTYGDGVCDTSCFSESCNFDNGDCNQVLYILYNKYITIILSAFV